MLRRPRGEFERKVGRLVLFQLLPIRKLHLLARHLFIGNHAEELGNDIQPHPLLKGVPKKITIDDILRKYGSILK